MSQNNGNKTLFLIDDEPNILLSLHRVLRKGGYDVHAFDDPAVALERLNELPVGVVVTDQCMPQMTGDQFLMAASEIQPQMKSIVLSGYSPSALESLAKSQFRAWRYLAKPCDDDKLRESVDEAFALFNSA